MSKVRRYWLLPLWCLRSHKTNKACLCSCLTGITAGTVDNKIFAWGNGTSGQLGDGDRTVKEQPVQVKLPQELNSVNIVGVACGSRHSFVWTEHGQAYSFGNNFYAQLGYDFQRVDYKEHQLVPRLFQNLPSSLKISQVACGERHTLFALEDGGVAACGQNDYGQVGSGSNENAVVPRLVEFVDGHHHVSKVTCGANHNLALTGKIIKHKQMSIYMARQPALVTSQFKTEHSYTAGDVVGRLAQINQCVENGIVCTVDSFQEKYSKAVVSIPRQSSLSQGGSSQADTSQAVQTSIRMFCFIHSTNTARQEPNGQMMRGEIEEERKETERQDEERSELMGTTERGREEIYQETRVIFNDPCMWREKTTPARSPPPNTDPLT
ncbi:uncharacterized protein V6R79_000862 [Siganus canaliculatus]